MWSKWSCVATATSGRSLDERLQRGSEVPDPVARVHDEVAIPAPDVPHVGLEERVEMVLHEQHDVLGDALRSEPLLGDRQLAHVRSVKNTDEASGRRQWTDTIEALYEPTFGIATMSPSSTSGIGWSSANRSLPSLM